MIDGGYNNAMNASYEVQAIIEQVRREVQAQYGPVGAYKAISYSRQVVAGLNYKVKVQVSNQKYIHIKVFVPLKITNNPPSLRQLERGKSLHDSL